MSTETMIKELEVIAEKYKNDFVPTFQINITTMCKDVIPKLKQLAEYEAIDTVEKCQNAKEKHIPKKYKKIQPCKYVNYYQCPYCDGLFTYKREFLWRVRTSYRLE